MDQLSAMRVFVRVVELGNFTRAAATLNMPKTTVTNLVQSLEAHLSTRLLNRTTRRVMVTTDGALYYERATQILAELDELDGSLSHAQAQPTGRLRVEMSGAFADRIVLPGICDFHSRYPQIQLDIGIGDRLVDYMAENVDCALRGGTPTDQSLVTRKVGELRLRCYASPLYLSIHGMPDHPRDLGTTHYCVGYLNAPSGRVWQMDFKRGDEVHEIDPRYIISVNDHRTYVSAGLSGIGVIQSTPFLVRDALAAGDLVPVLEDWECETIPLYIVYPGTRHISNKVRVFVDWMVKRVQQMDAPDADEPAQYVAKTG